MIVPLCLFFFFFFFFNDPATTELYTLSLHDALPILPGARPGGSRDDRDALPLPGRAARCLAGRVGHEPRGNDPARGGDHPRRARGHERRRGRGPHGAHPRDDAMTRDHGFVLIAVLLTLTLMAVIVTELAFSARLEASMVRSYRDRVLARHLAEAAVQQAMREIATPSQVAALDETGQLVFYRALPGQTTPTPLPALPRVRVALGPGEFSYRLIDESARLALNVGSDRLGRLLEALGLERAERDIITDSVQDWRDADELHRLHGAESGRASCRERV